jgi:hypothetical protein
VQRRVELVGFAQSEQKFRWFINFDVEVNITIGLVEQPQLVYKEDYLFY